jgi:hypothetical protein
VHLEIQQVNNNCKKSESTICGRNPKKNKVIFSSNFFTIFFSHCEGENLYANNNNQHPFERQHKYK